LKITLLAVARFEPSIAMVLPKVVWVKLLSFVAGSVSLILSIVGAGGALPVSSFLQALKTNKPARINIRTLLLIFLFPENMFFMLNLFN
jgi:hypothetical protein